MHLPACIDVLFACLSTHAESAPQTLGILGREWRFRECWRKFICRCCAFPGSRGAPVDIGYFVFGIFIARPQPCKLLAVAAKANACLCMQFTPPHRGGLATPKPCCVLPGVWPASCPSVLNPVPAEEDYTLHHCLHMPLTQQASSGCPASGDADVRSFRAPAGQEQASAQKRGNFISFPLFSTRPAAVAIPHRCPAGLGRRNSSFEVHLCQRKASQNALRAPKSHTYLGAAGCSRGGASDRQPPNWTALQSPAASAGDP